MKQLLTNCGILATENGKFSWIPKGYLGIDGSTIDYIGTEKPQGYDQEKDMTGRMLAPGLVNCHTHAAMTLLRGLGSDLPLSDWLFGTIIPVEDKMSPEDIQAGIALAMAEMLASGTTSFSDMYMEAAKAVELNETVGMKMNLCRVMQGFDPSETYEANGRGAESLALYNQFHGALDGRVRMDFSIHGEYTCQPHLVKAYSEECAKTDAHMHIHLAETKAEQDACVEKYGKTPTQFFRDLGTFEVPTFAAHCVWVTEEDMDILADKHVSVVHNPTSNMKLASGFAPLTRMQEKGIHLALGTDGAASNNNLNMMEELHLASVIHKGHLLSPTAMPAETVLQMATCNGAKVQGRLDTGSLEVGKKADIIAIDLQKPHLFPNLDPVALMTYSIQGSDVAMTMVDGKILYENGVYYTLDIEKVYHNAQVALDHLL